MNTLIAQEFHLRGEFAGLFRDVFGNRQMVLRSAGEEIFLEISKALCRELEGILVVGQEVVVTGEEPSTEVTGRRRRIVSQVRRPEASVPRGGYPVRVCANKTCWRNGGQELWRTLEQKIAESGLVGVVALKPSPCMDLCKRGPNVEVGGQEYHGCSSSTADEILAPFMGKQLESANETAVRI